MKKNPNADYDIEDGNFECYKAPIENETKAIDEAADKVVASACSMPDIEKGCDFNPMDNGSYETAIKLLKELKESIVNNKPYEYKAHTSANVFNAEIAIGDVCYDPIYTEYTSVKADAKKVDKVSFSKEITTSFAQNEYWTLTFDGFLAIKIQKEMKDGKDISKDKIDLLEKWLKCGGKAKEEAIVKPATINITAGMLSKVFGNKDIKRLEEVAKAINKYSDEFEINTPLRMSHFLAQIGVETGGLKDLKEEVCYTSKSRIKEVFGKTYYCDLFEGYNSDLNLCSKGHPSPCTPSLTEVTSSLIIKDKYVCSSLLMDYVYSCRMGNGNPLSKDGSTFMGKGFIHLTGKSNYEAISNAWNAYKENKYNQKYFHKQNKDGGHINELENIEVAMKASLIFWSIPTGKPPKNGNGNADNDDVKAVTKFVNGGENGYKEREIYTNELKKIIK